MWRVDKDNSQTSNTPEFGIQPSHALISGGGRGQRSARERKQVVKTCLLLKGRVGVVYVLTY